MTQKTTYKFSYSFEAEDIIALRKFMLRHPKFYKRNLILVIILTVIFLTVMLPSLLEDQKIQLDDYIAIAFFIGLILFFMNNFSKSYIRNSKALKESFGLAHVEVNHEYYTVELNSIVNKFPWTKFKDLQETKTHLFLFLNENSALILSKEKIMPEEDREPVFDFIRSKLKLDPN